MAEVDQKSGKSRSLKLVLIIAGALVLVGGAAAGGYFAAGKASAPAGGHESAGERGTGPVAPSAPPLGPLVQLNEFIANIMDGQETRYLKATITLELSDPEAAAEIGRREAQVRDAILLLIGSKSFDELRDLHGKLQLRADLVGKINAFLPQGQVKEIYFTEFVIQ